MKRVYISELFSVPAPGLLVDGGPLVLKLTSWNNELQMGTAWAFGVTCPLEPIKGFEFINEAPAGAHLTAEETAQALVEILERETWAAVRRQQVFPQPPRAVNLTETQEADEQAAKDARIRGAMDAINRDLIDMANARFARLDAFAEGLVSAGEKAGIRSA